MSWSTELDALLGDTVKVVALSGWSTDGYGKPVFTSATTYSARVARRQELVRTFDGTEELCAAVAWLRSTSTFSPLASYTLGGSSNVMNLLAVESYPDEDGVHHAKLMFG